MTLPPTEDKARRVYALGVLSVAVMKAAKVGLLTPIEARIAWEYIIDEGTVLGVNIAFTIEEAIATLGKRDEGR